MRNPWLKKNPLLSLWLSGANTMAGALRGQAATQARRQGTRAMTRATRDLLGAWAVDTTDTPSAKTKTGRG